MARPGKTIVGVPENERLLLGQLTRAAGRPLNRK
jgi:hypothetical protein